MGLRTPSAEQFEELVHSEMPSLLRLARLLTYTEFDAEDLVQSAFVQAADKWQHLSRASDRGAYIRRMMINLHNTAGRRAKRAKNQLPAPASAIDPHVMVETRTDLVAELQRLPATQRCALVLKYYAGLSAEEIGNELGLKPSSVRAALARGLEALRKASAFDERLEGTHERLRG